MRVRLLLDPLFQTPKSLQWISFGDEVSTVQDFKDKIISIFKLKTQILLFIDGFEAADDLKIETLLRDNDIVHVKPDIQSVTSMTLINQGNIQAPIPKLFSKKSSLADHSDKSIKKKHKRKREYNEQDINNKHKQKRFRRSDSDSENEIVEENIRKNSHQQLSSTQKQENNDVQYSENSSGQSNSGNKTDNESSENIKSSSNKKKQVSEARLEQRRQRRKKQKNKSRQKKKQEKEEQLENDRIRLQVEYEKEQRIGNEVIDVDQIQSTEEQQQKQKHILFDLDQSEEEQGQEDGEINQQSTLIQQISNPIQIYKYASFHCLTVIKMRPEEVQIQNAVVQSKSERDVDDNHIILHLTRSIADSLQSIGDEIEPDIIEIRDYIQDEDDIMMQFNKYDLIDLHFEESDGIKNITMSTIPQSYSIPTSTQSSKINQSKSSENSHQTPIQSISSLIQTNQEQNNSSSTQIQPETLTLGTNPKQKEQNIGRNKRNKRINIVSSAVLMASDAFKEALKDADEQINSQKQNIPQTE